MALNRVWHEAHVLGRNPTAQQRLEWHLEHAEACGCRKLTDEMRERLFAAAEKQKSRSAG